MVPSLIDSTSNNGASAAPTAAVSPRRVGCPGLVSNARRPNTTAVSSMKTQSGCSSAVDTRITEKPPSSSMLTYPA